VSFAAQAATLRTVPKVQAMPGNALHRLFPFSQPSVQPVVTVTFKEISEEDAKEVPSVHRETVLHLHRQAIRISRGKQIEDVTALSIPEIDSGASVPGRTE
jgi:hypothetical protein